MTSSPSVESRKASWHVAQVVAEHLVLAFQPARAKTQDHSPAAEIIERERLPGQHDWITKEQRCDQRPEVDAMCMVGQVGKGDQQLKRVEINWKWKSEVIRPEDSVEA